MTLLAAAFVPASALAQDYDDYGTAEAGNQPTYPGIRYSWKSLGMVAASPARCNEERMNGKNELEIQENPALDAARRACCGL